MQAALKLISNPGPCTDTYKLPTEDFFPTPCRPEVHVECWFPFPLIPTGLSLKNCHHRTTAGMLSINSADNVFAEYFPAPPSFSRGACVCFSPSLEVVVSSLEPLQRKSLCLIYDVLIHPRRRAYHSRMTDKRSKMKRARSGL